MSLEPPLNHFHKAARDMIDEKFIGKIGAAAAAGFILLIQKLHPDQFIQAVLEVAEKDFAAFTGQQSQNIAVIFLKMLQKVAENRFRCTAVGVKSVSVGAVHGAVYNMTEQFAAQFFQQVILCFKMGVEGAAPDIRSVNNLLHGNIIVAFLTQQGGE